MKLIRPSEGPAHYNLKIDKHHHQRLMAMTRALKLNSVGVTIQTALGLLETMIAAHDAEEDTTVGFEGTGTWRYVPEAAKCRSCNGTGLIKGLCPCAACGGTGRKS